MKKKNSDNDKINIKQITSVESAAHDPAFFVENTSDWLWACDLGLSYTYSNGRLFDILGYAPDEICGRSFFEFVHKEDIERVRPLFEEAVKDGRTIGMARIGVHKNGCLVALRTVAAPFYDGAGNIAGYRGIDSDITKYNLEEKLKESQDIFSLFMQNFPGGVYIKDSETRLLFFNKRFEELLGVKLDGMIGKSDEEIWGDEFGKSMWVEDMKVLIQGKGEEREESWTVAPTGRLHTFLSRRFQIPKHGRSPLLGGITIDITGRKDIENALKRSERLYYTTINSMFDWIFVIDEDMKIVLMNDAFKAINEELGLESDIVGKHINILSHFLSKDPEEEYGRIFKDGREFFFENTLKITGRALILEIRKTPVFDGEKVVRVVTNIRDITERKRVEEEIKTARKELLAKHSFNDIIGRSLYMKSVFDIIPTIAGHDCNVLIEGATGTGKSLIAEVIHNVSGRVGKPFLTINCGALPDTLLESELFGYAKGAFTGADRSKPGKFEAASGGTIFLDEIGELPLNLQVKLLRVIEKKTYEPLGANNTIEADVRIIAATNVDLASLVQTGKFRADLYYRLKIVSLKIPPLKDRHEDTELLIEHFMGNFNAKYHKNISRVSKEVFEFLMSYEFPGNIRELQNIIDYAFIFCKGDEIGAEHLSQEYAQIIEKKESQASAFRQNARNLRERMPAAGTADVADVESAASKLSNAEKKEEEAVKIAGCEHKAGDDKAVSGGENADDASRDKMKTQASETDEIRDATHEKTDATVADFAATDARGDATVAANIATDAQLNDEEKLQKKSIIEVLLKFGGNKVAAAKFLNIDRTTLWRRMKKLGLM